MTGETPPCRLAPETGLRGYAQLGGCFRYCQAQAGENVFSQSVAGMRRIVHSAHGSFLSVVTQIIHPHGIPSMGWIIHEMRFCKT